jgi:hypothetical protein
VVLGPFFPLEKVDHCNPSIYMGENQMACQCGKNQTNPEVLKHCESKGENPETSIGFGLFLVPAPEFGILEWKTVVVEDMSYVECAKRGANCKAFQWIRTGFVVNLSTKDGKKLSLPVSSRADLDALRNNCAAIQPFCGPGVFCVAGCWCNYQMMCQPQ